MSERAFAQFAEDWQNITDGWIADLEREMDAAYAAGDHDGRYLAAARQRDQIRQAQRVMWDTLPEEVRTAILVRQTERMAAAIGRLAAATDTSAAAVRAFSEATSSASVR